ncbi:MAG: hypothetical protein KA004_04675 [Verrucomicrobiales bacterium]|nr:hypothetical protein [Verrucomicrobiales bacterium]
MNLRNALARLEGAFAARIRRGITVGGLTLRAGDTDRTAFAQLLVMLGEAERLNALPGETTITDIHGVPHVLPTPQIRALLVTYGSIYHGIWLQRVQMENAIRAAADDAARAAVPVNF